MLIKGIEYTVNSYRGDAPTIDGIIDTQEEIGTGKPVKIALPLDPWDPYGEPRKMDINIGSSYTNDSYLYINAVVNFNNIITGNITYTFDRNFSQTRYDMKRVSSITNSSEDGYRTNAYDSLTFFKDQKNGGTLDSEGKCIITDKTITFELRMPFNSGDSLGYDENFIVGDDLEIIIVLYIKYRKTNDDIWSVTYINSNCFFKILNTTADPISLAGIGLGLILIGVIIIRKKKKKIN